LVFEHLDWSIYGRKPQAGEETKFRHVRVLQRFRWNGGLLCQRIDRSRDALGPYNAVVLDGDDGPKRVHILGHEKVEIVD